MMKTGKRFFSFLLLLCIFLPSLQGLAMEVGESFTLSNPGFEKNNTTWEGWNIKEAAASCFSIDSAKAHSGKNALKMDFKSGAMPWAKVSIGLPTSVRGAVFECSVWMNMQVDRPATGAGIFTEQWAGSGNFLTDYQFGVNLTFNTNNQWTKLTLSVPTTTKSTSIQFYICCRSTGTVWFDDAEIKLASEPEPYAFYADHVFHYPDEKTGNAYISLDNYYKETDSEALNVTGRFTFYDTDGKTVLDQKSVMSFTRRKMQYTYPVSLMKKEKARYKLVAELIDTSKKVIASWSENMYVYPRPLMMEKSGRFVVDGEPFYPIIAYTMDIEAYDEIAEGGWNVTSTGGGISVWSDALRDEYFKAMEENGIKCLFNLYPDMLPAGHPQNAARTKSIVEKYKNNKNIFAWMVMDEPLGNLQDTAEKKAWLEESYRIIRDIDPLHPVYLVDYGQNVGETIKYCDVFVADVYSWGESAKGVSEVIEPLSEAHPRLSVYELAACYKNSTAFPPVNTIRGSIYRGIETGRGFGAGYYNIMEAIGQNAGDPKVPLYETELWGPIKTINTEELPILFSYFGDGQKGRFNFEKIGTEHMEIYWETWFDDDGEMYLLAHNRSDTSFAFEIPLRSADGRINIAAYEAEPIGLTKTGKKQGGNEICFTLAGEEIALYRIRPKEIEALGEQGETMYAGIYAENGDELLSFTAGNTFMVQVPNDPDLCLKIYTFASQSLNPKRKIQYIKGNNS